VPSVCSASERLRVLVQLKNEGINGSSPYRVGKNWGESGLSTREI
jgi:hypothetical protein